MGLELYVGVTGHVMKIEFYFEMGRGMGANLGQPAARIVGADANGLRSTVKQFVK